MPAFHAPTDQRTDKAVAVFIAPGLEEVEALATVDILFRAGIPTTMISVTPERTVTSSHNIVVTCDLTLAEANLADYDMLVLPGGIPGTPNLKAVEPLTIGDDGDVELPVSDGGLSVYAPETAKPILDNAEQHLLRQR